MPFLGSTPPANYKTLTKQTITGDGSTSYTLDSKVANGNEIEVFVNNVRQEPGTDYSANNNTITFTTALTSSDSCWLVFQSKAESTSTITNDNYGGAINVNTSAADNSINIDASGNVGIGTTTPSQELHIANDSGTYVEIDSQTSTPSNGNAGISLYNNLGAKADILIHRSGLTQDLVFRNSTDGEGILFRTNGNNDRMYIKKDGDVQILGGNGIYIGGTASANKLDDYEEGTWDPVSTGNVYHARYTKIGRIVHINVTINVANGDSFSSFTLPFQPTNVVTGTGLSSTEQVRYNFPVQHFQSGSGTSSINIQGLWQGNIGTNCYWWAVNTSGTQQWTKTISKDSSGNGISQITMTGSFCVA